MTLEVRRAVVENDANGQSTVSRDEVLTAANVQPNAGIRGCELWVTDAMPVDNSAQAAAAQQEGSLERFHNLYVRNGEGSAFRITEFPPNAPKVAHRTETVDYDLVLSGEIDLELDNAQTLHLKAGDSIIVRGALHAWNNRSAASAVVAFVMIDAKPELERFIRTGVIQDTAQMRFSLSHIEQAAYAAVAMELALIGQNIVLMMQAIGLGGWMYSGIFPYSVLGAFASEGIAGLGFRFVQREEWRLPNPVGLDGYL